MRTMPNSPASPGEPDRDQRKRLRAVLTQYQQPSTARALWQFFNTIVPYVLLWY